MSDEQAEPSVQDGLAYVRDNPASDWSTWAEHFGPDHQGALRAAIKDAGFVKVDEAGGLYLTEAGIEALNNPPSTDLGDPSNEADNQPGDYD